MSGVMSGKVWSDPDGGQHYIEFSFRGVSYRITNKWRKYRGRIYVQAISTDGNNLITWSDAEGNFLS